MNINNDNQDIAELTDHELAQLEGGIASDVLLVIGAVAWGVGLGVRALYNATQCSDGYGSSALADVTMY